jgi:hypothetical protein
MPKDKYFPDSKEPHLHYHKGGVTFTSTGHRHKALVDGDKTNKSNCKAVYEDLIGGNDREKSIAEKIEDEFL